MVRSVGKRNLFSALMTAAVLVFFVHIVIRLYIVRTRPREPNPPSGRVYRLQEHYVVVYLTLPEYLVAGPLPFGVASVLGLMAFYSRSKHPGDDVVR